MISVKGRRFGWYVLDDRELHVYSMDRRFIVTFNLIWDNPFAKTAPQLKVVGLEFPGVPTGRPTRLYCPLSLDRTPGSVRALIEWCLDASRQPPARTTDPDV
jgi:hypothetical protein